MPSDTLQIDHQLLEQLQQDPRYAYIAEEQKPSVFSELIHSLDRWLSEHVGNSEFPFRYVFYTICILAVVVLVWWMVRSQLLHRILGIRHEAEVSIEEAEENIHSVDFDAEIARALAAGDHTRAARLLYLQTLKRLDDAGRLQWQPQKTPTQYTLEVAGMPFRTLTNHFLRIRYGGFEADEQLFSTMKTLQAEVEKGGTA